MLEPAVQYGRAASTRCARRPRPRAAGRGRAAPTKSSMSEILIHAGTHKTGTTTIQDTLRHNRARLKAARLVYPAIGRAAGHHLLAAEWLSHLAPVPRRAAGRRALAPARRPACRGLARPCS